MPSLAIVLLLTACTGTSAREQPPSPPAVAPAASSSDVAPAVAPAPMLAPSTTSPAPQTLLPAPKPGPTSIGLPPPAIKAAGAVVMDEASGQVLFEIDAHRRLPPASLTKIATAALVIERANLDEVIEVHPDLDRYLREDYSTMKLEPGDSFSIGELLHGMLIASGNDAAEELAEHVSGDIPAFVAEMNRLASRLGLRDTHFIDPHGIGGPDHYSSAFDLAVLARYAMTMPAFRDVVAKESYTAHGSRELPLLNDNPLLGYTEGVDGVKTGYTEEAGLTYVASVVRNGHRVYVVLLNAPNRAFDAIALIEWTFANWRWG